MTYRTKIDAPLAERMEMGSSAPIPVLIEMAEQPDAPPAIDRSAEMDALARQADASQRGIMEHLRGLGRSEDDVERFALVNALAVSLSPAEIRIVAEREDVRFVRYNGEANVAL